MGKFGDIFDKENREVRKSNRSANQAERQASRQESWSNVKDAFQKGKDSATAVVDEGVERFKSPAEFMPFYTGPGYLPCFRYAVNEKYISEGTETAITEAYDRNADHNRDATVIFQRFPDWSRETLASCQAKAEVERKSGQGAGGAGGASGATQTERDAEGQVDQTPFDRRLDRLFVEANQEPVLRTPFAGKYRQSSTVGLLASEKLINDSELEDKDDTIKALRAERERLIKDPLYIGIPSLMNTYSLTKLYGSEGGQNLLNRRGDRRWYEVDQAFGTASTGTNGLN